MSDDWCPGAERHNGTWGSSNVYQAGTPKIVWHTTESDAGSTKGNLAWATSQGYGPHLWWDPYTGEVTQSLPLSTPATALFDPNGAGWNRAGRFVLQVEVIGRASKAPLATSPMHGLEIVMHWVRALGLPDQFPAGVPKGAVSGDRRTYRAASPAGHYTHSQIPDNSHVDPGRIDAALLFGGSGDMALDDYISGQAAAREAFRKDGTVGDAPNGKGQHFVAGWNDVRWTSLRAGKDGKDGKPGKDGTAGPHTHLPGPVAP